MSTSLPASEQVQLGVRDSESSRPRVVSKRRRRGKRVGTLAPLLDLSLDILFEVISYLQPPDLLRLCRISKRFRAIFLSKSSRTLWVSARENFDGPALPSPPPHLSEPAFASLLFERLCSACALSGHTQRSYTLGLQFCDRCWGKNVYVGSALLKALDPKKELPRDIMLQINLRERTGRYYEPDLFCRSQFESVVNKYRSIQNSDASALSAFVQERKDLVDAVEKGASAMRQWEKDLEEYRRNVRTEIAARRRASIKQRLFQLGYTDDFFPTRACETQWSDWNNYLHDPQELTEKLWKRIGTHMIKMIDECHDILVIENRKKRTRARDLEFQELYKQFIKANLINGPYPAIQDLRSLPALSLLLTENDSNIVFDSSRFETHIIPMVNQMRNAKIQDRIDTVHRSYARHAGQDIGNDTTTPTEEILYRATTLFPNPGYRCSLNCTEPPYKTFSEKLRSLWPPRQYGINFSTKIESDWIFADHNLPYEIADPKTAMGILTMLHLPEDTPYTDISGKAVCTCGQPSFEQPTTFARLLGHIETEWSLCEAIRARGGNTLPDTMLPGDHDVRGGACFVKLLRDGEVPPSFEADQKLCDEIKGVSDVRYCSICVALGFPFDDDYYMPKSNALKPLSPEELIWHVMYKHGRPAQVTDAYVLQPGRGGDRRRRRRRD